MSILDYNKLCLDAKNETVYAFETLVDQALGYASAKLDNINISGATAHTVSKFTKDLYDKVQTVSEINATAHNVSKFTKDLYDKVQTVSEINATELPKSLIAGGDYIYAKFIGSNIYKSLDGTIDKLSKMSNKLGWITLDNLSSEYAFLKNTVGTYIVSLSDIKPESIITDFQSLYDKLQETRFAGSDRFFNDINTALSLVTTYRNIIAPSIANIEQDDIITHTETDQICTLTDFKHYTLSESPSPALLQMPINSDDNSTEQPQYKLDNYKLKKVPDYFHGVYPKQISVQPLESSLAFNQNAVNEIQAIIYDLPEYNEKNYSNGKSYSILYCFQKPENIAYNAAASFDTVSPRGSQQPFQFYASANAIDLAFTLEFHIDEVRTLKKANGGHYSLQDIADIAENFTRPWIAESDGGNVNSVKPKVVKVVLPGVSEIGYMTQANITYSGDMTGDMTQGGGLASMSKGILTNYHYTQLQVSFTLVLLKDIKLHKGSDASFILSDLYKGIVDTAYHKTKYISANDNNGSETNESTSNSEEQNISENDKQNMTTADESKSKDNKPKDDTVDGAQKYADDDQHNEDIGLKTSILERAYRMMVEKISI